VVVVVHLIATVPVIMLLLAAAVEWRMVLLTLFLDRLYQQSQLALLEQVIQYRLQPEAHQVSVL
jgi:hypothetical protein